jgi:hypothetical protein
MRPRTLVAVAVAVTQTGSTLAVHGARPAVLPGPQPAWARAAPRGHSATCAQQASADFPGAFRGADNLVAGPFALIGAGLRTPAATAIEFGGGKFPALVKAGHTVTVAVRQRARRSASFFYGFGGGTLIATRVGDGRAAITFRACNRRHAASDADGEPVTFWSGFVLVSKPMCVPLKVWIDGKAEPRRRGIALGRDC